jgi:hypothetical protein
LAKVIAMANLGVTRLRLIYIGAGGVSATKEKKRDG